jgi:gliding motility-associated-like protein
VSNANANETFWLQKLVNANNGIWGSPETNVAYNEGTIPDETNSYLIANNTTTFNLLFSGTFRILRSFSAFNNGVEINAGSVSSFERSCLEVLSPTFSYYQQLEIVDAYRMPCSPTNSLDVVLSVNGSSTLQYSIVEKDGLPFSFNNGNSNIFSNLGPGIYKFQVQDNCGNIVNQIFDVNNLLSLITETTPDDLLLCKAVVTNEETFDLSVQSPIILGTQPANLYIISYHETLEDAKNNTGEILNLTAYNPNTNPQTIFARIVYSLLPNCYETTSFDLIVGQNPRLLLQPSYSGCQSTPITLNAGVGNLSTTTYLWSDGSTAPTYTVSNVGISVLTITATNSYGSPGQGCSVSNQIEVAISDAPIIDRIETSDWTNNENSITAITSNSGSFEYSLDNETFQEESTFNNLAPGVYTIYVQDKLGCGFFQKEVWLLYYPYFFTPNNDGYNDTWFVANSENEPELKIYIYDRYGKLIKYLDGQDKSWDGMCNGNQAVSSDYWFVVNRQDGRTHRGHFTLKR